MFPFCWMGMVRCPLLRWVYSRTREVKLNIIYPGHHLNSEPKQMTSLLIFCLHFSMKVTINFVHRNEGHDPINENDNTDIDDGPLQLIRPMPNELVNYVIIKDYENFCIRKIDPLLEALYEAEKAVNQCRNFSIIILFVLVILTIDSFALLCCISLVLMFIIGCAQYNYPAKQIQGKIRAECENMSNQCSAGIHNKDVFFELVMRRVQESADKIGVLVQVQYSRKISHIAVTILDKQECDSDYYRQLPNFEQIGRIIIGWYSIPIRDLFFYEVNKQTTAELRTNWTHNHRMVQHTDKGFILLRSQQTF